MTIVVDGALIVGALAVLPLGATVHPQLVDTRLPRLALGAGAAAALGVLLGPGLLAALLLVPLALWTTVAGVVSLRASVRRPTLQAGATTVALGYLGVAVVWLAAHLLLLEPVATAPPFVALTAIHFIYAGYAATLITARIRALAVDRLPATSTTGLLATMAGPPLVAVGFALGNALQVVGALVLTIGLYLAAGVLVRGVVPLAPGRPRALLAVAAIAIVVPMLLAVHWAAGTTFGFATLSVPDMARTHGAVNALGFTLPALAGLRLLHAGARPPDPPDCAPRPRPAPCTSWPPS